MQNYSSMLTGTQTIQKRKTTTSDNKHTKLNVSRTNKSHWNLQTSSLYTNNASFYDSAPSSFSLIFSSSSLLVKGLSTTGFKTWFPWWTRTYSWPFECISPADAISFWLRFISCRDTAVSNSLSLFSSRSGSLSSSSLQILY